MSLKDSKAWRIQYIELTTLSLGWKRVGWTRVGKDCGEKESSTGHFFQQPTHQILLHRLDQLLIIRVEVSQLIRSSQKIAAQQASHWPEFNVADIIAISMVY